MYIAQQVHVYLKSNSWDTRIAAGQAIEAIAQNVPQWDPATVQNIKGAVCKIGSLAIHVYNPIVCQL